MSRNQDSTRTDSIGRARVSVWDFDRNSGEIGSEPGKRPCKGADLFARGRHDRCPEPTMPTCDHCGAHVSEQFARVFTDESGNLHACTTCSANCGIAEVSRERAQRA